MALDLSDSFQLAYENSHLWTPERVNGVVHELFDRFAAALDDWDASTGEEWAQFSANGQPILLLRTNLPLAIIVSGSEGVLDDIPVVVISADDFNHTHFSMDAGMMQALFSPNAVHALNPDSFTINELWRASI